MNELELSALAKIFFTVVLTDASVRSALRDERVSAVTSREHSKEFIRIVNGALGEAGRIDERDVRRFAESLVDLARKAEPLGDRPIADENVAEYFGVTITALIDIHG